MWRRKYNIFTNIFILIICSSCLAPHYAIFYENLDFPTWSERYDTWSRDDEVWKMRGYDPSIRHHDFDGPLKKRDQEIVNKYILNGALCYVYIFAKNATTISSNNPYHLSIIVYGILGEHHSFTIKQVSVNQINNNVSHLINNEFPVTIILEKEHPKAENNLIEGKYQTKDILKFKKEKINITITLEINGINGSESGNIAFELSPYVRKGLFISPL
jgi:hypothetical protein